jgi:hypothetical protein
MQPVSTKAMNDVLFFPELRGKRARTGHPSQLLHAARGGGVMSWVCAAACECCGRPTLAGPSGREHRTLCGHCSPSSIA